MDLGLFKQKLEKLVPDTIIKYDEPMKKHTSFKVGGPADILVLPSTIEDIKKVINLCIDMNIDYFVMGNGSNLVVKDGGFRGVIIKLMQLNRIVVDGTTVTAECGSLLSQVASEALKYSLHGVEFASGIPGSVGGAVAMNAGAYGPEIKDILEWAEVLDCQGNILKLSNPEMMLGYRDSIVQRKNYVVLSACFKLEEGDSEAIKNRMMELNKRRADKQPLTYPSAGSTFKRPEGYYAAKLIDDSGLKGRTCGGAQVSEKHSGFIINTGDATAKDILDLIQIVKDTVKEKYNVNIEPEIKIIGEDI